MATGQCIVLDYMADWLAACTVTQLPDSGSIWPADWGCVYSGAADIITNYCRALAVFTVPFDRVCFEMVDRQITC